MNIEKQKKILEFMNMKNVRSVEVVFDQTGDPELVKVKEVNEIDKSSRLSDNLSKIGFQTMTVKTRNGAIIHSEIITNYKFPNPKFQ